MLSHNVHPGKRWTLYSCFVLYKHKDTNTLNPTSKHIKIHTHTPKTNTHSHTRIKFCYFMRSETKKTCFDKLVQRGKKQQQQKPKKKVKTMKGIKSNQIKNQYINSNKYFKRKLLFSSSSSFYNLKRIKKNKNCWNSEKALHSKLIHKIVKQICWKCFE